MIVRCNPMIMRFRTITSVHCLPANGRDKNKRPDNFVKSTKKGILPQMGTVPASSRSSHDDAIVPDDTFINMISKYGFSR
jgi:hypothetical protein